MQDITPPSHVDLKQEFCYHFVYVVSENGTGTGGDAEIEEEETNEKPVEPNVRMIKITMIA